MFIAQKIVIPFFSLFSLKCHPELVNSSHLTFTSLGSVEYGGGLKLTGGKKKPPMLTIHLGPSIRAN